MFGSAPDLSTLTSTCLEEPQVPRGQNEHDTQQILGSTAYRKGDGVKATKFLSTLTG